MGSRGSVIPYFLKKRKDGVLPLTDVRMTRFNITLQEGVDFVISCFWKMWGGELFVPKLPSYRVVDVATAIAPDAKHEIVGIRPGEKLHEVMIPYEESRNCIDMGDHYILQPGHHWWNVEAFLASVQKKGQPIDKPFEYASDSNDHWYSDDALKALVDSIPVG